MNLSKSANILNFCKKSTQYTIKYNKLDNLLLLGKAAMEANRRLGSLKVIF